MLEKNEQMLVDMAIEARKNAYTPYSHFKVGAAVLLTNGKVISGCNVENASYGLCNCAERTAMFKAYSEGYRKEDMVMIAIVADTPGPCSPCGACRQVMSELLPLNSKVIMANLKGDTKVMSVDELIPLSFSSEDL